MSATNQIKIMLFKEVLNYISPEHKGNSSIILSPSHYVFLGVWPDEVAEEPLVGDFDRPYDFIDLVEPF